VVCIKEKIPMIIENAVYKKKFSLKCISRKKIIWSR